MVKINSAISLLSELCNFMLLRVPNNTYDSTGMLNIDEGVVLVDNRLKILLCFADSEREVHTRKFLKQCKDRISIPERESRVLQSCVSVSKCEVRVQRETRVLPAPKCDTRVLPVSERETRISNSKRETRILRQAQPTLETHISTQHKVCVSTKKRETRIQNGMSSRHKKSKIPHP